MDIRIQENHVVFRAIFLAMCMSAVSHVWAAQFTAPATGVLTSHNQRACLSWLYPPQYHVSQTNKYKMVVLVCDGLL